MHINQQPQFDNRPDNEGAMARADLYKLANYSLKLFKMMESNTQLEGWVQAKITKAADYIASVYHYMEYEKMAAGQIESGPRDFEESIQNSVKQSLRDQWQNRKNQGN